MDSDTVIHANGLGKKYAIGHRTEDAGATLRDAIARGAGGLVRATRDMLRGRPLIAGDEIEEFWALCDVSFEVRRGEVLGIIGRNGAGKSTLLKILSRITDPSEGRVEIRGRVASLLEVGTGFHPELTGRENIFLNGAILGMTRVEIRRKFDEIVAFAGVEKFLDTPVKRFSSGMYVRLAFAVAAHLEPEILIVDEVLAVGDAEFQKKCLGKMQDVAGQGRTVLFVSHNMAAAKALCQRGLVLEHGRVAFSGSVSEAIDHYTAVDGHNVSQRLFKTIELVDLRLEYRDSGNDSHLAFEVRLELKENTIIQDLSLIIYGDGGTRLGVVDLRESLQLPRRFEPTQLVIAGQVMGLRLIEREYQVGLYVGDDHQAADFHSLSSFRPSPPANHARRYPAENLGYFDASPSNVVAALQ